MTSIQWLLQGKMKKWFYAILAVFIFLLLLPFMVQFSLLYAVSNSGAGKASLKDVDINVFSGVVVLKQFYLESEGLEDEKTSLLEIGEVFINFGWLGLLERDYLVEEFTVKSIRLSANQADDGIWHVIIPLRGFDEEEGTDLADEPIILPRIDAHKIQFTDLEISINSPSVSGLLLVEDFNLQRLSTWKEDPATLYLKGAWNGAPLEVNLSAEWIKQVPTMEGHMKGKGLQLADLQPLLREHLSSLKGEAAFEFDVQGSRNTEGVVSIVLEGSVSAEEIALAYQNYQLGNKRLAWDGSISLNLDEAFEILEITGDVEAAAFDATDKAKSMELATFERLTMDGLVLDRVQTMSLDRLNFKNLTLLRPDNEDKSWLNTGKLELESLLFNADKQLTIGTINMVDGQYLVAFSPEGELLLARAFEANAAESTTPKNDSPSAQQEAAQQNAVSIRIDKLQLTGNSYLEIRDYGVKPPFTKKIHVEQLSLADLNQSTPDAKAALTIKARFGEFSKLEVSGWITPFSPEMNTSLQGKIDALSLPPFSAYSEKFIGYQIPTGQLDHTFDLAIQDQTLSMKNNLQFRRLKLKEVNRDKAENFADGIGVPFGLGLDLMRDNDGAIRIDVPINGRLDDPAVKINTIVSKAMGKAITKASIQYLKYIIQPYGSLLVASDFIGKQWSSVTLEPVLFTPGTDNLSAEHLDYLNKISELLSKRKKLELDVCGYVSEADQQVLAENAAQTNNPQTQIEKSQLTALATNRTLNVKRYLVDKGIDSKRLLQCKVSTDDKRINGVTLSM